MKRVVFCVVFCVLLCVWFACTSGKPIHSEPVTQADYLQLLKDSVSKLNAEIEMLTSTAATYEKYLVVYENERVIVIDSIELLIDSINKLNQRPLMNKQQFLDLYKFERLLKYYKLCKARQVNWKYYRGWSTRVFENTSP